MLDTIGELATAYRFATVAFVGGTLIPHGGQSILEPAWYAKPIVIGPSMENFRQIAKDFRDRGAVRQIQAIGSDKEAQIRGTDGCIRVAARRREDANGDGEGGLFGF